MGHKLMKRHDRVGQIKKLFQITATSEMTANDVARVLDLSSSSWLRRLLAELVEDGYLVAREVPHRANINKLLYSPGPKMKLG